MCLSLSLVCHHFSPLAIIIMTFCPPVLPNHRLSFSFLYGFCYFRLLVIIVGASSLHPFPFIISSVCLLFTITVFLIYRRFRLCLDVTTPVSLHPSVCLHHKSSPSVIIVASSFLIISTNLTFSQLFVFSFLFTHTSKETRGRRGGEEQGQNLLGRACFRFSLCVWFIT